MERLLPNCHTRGRIERRLACVRGVACALNGRYGRDPTSYFLLLTHYFLLPTSLPSYFLQVGTAGILGVLAEAAGGLEAKQKAKYAGGYLATEYNAWLEGTWAGPTIAKKA